MSTSIYEHALNVIVRTEKRDPINELHTTAIKILAENENELNRKLIHLLCLNVQFFACNEHFPKETKMKHPRKY
jgi:hypothetical protein